MYQDSWKRLKFLIKQKNKKKMKMKNEIGGKYRERIINEKKKNRRKKNRRKKKKE